jgi:phosphopantothenoylcysteine decarboxylase/phosphopantothenate--cysteine ligase
MYSSLPCERLLVGVSGSIHATHLIDYLVRFRRQFAREVRVIMTPTATQMIAPSAVELAVDAPVVTDLWGAADVRSPHIRLTRWAELFVVVPATANIIGKAANGIADDLLSTAILASADPVVFAPAMNPTMWASAAVKRNVATLRTDGHYVVEPGEGRSLTTGDLDAGLVPTPVTLLPHLWHVRMRRLRAAYWTEATATAPRTPAVARALPVIPVDAVLAGRQAS